MKTTPCRGCARPIVFARTADGKTIPLDPRPPIYLVTQVDGEASAVRDTLITTTDGAETSHMVTHFATCPKAAEFSRGKRVAP